MKVIAINGSPRSDGNTRILIDIIANQLKEENIETEVIQLGGKKVHGCTACRKCFEIKDKRCHIQNDVINEAIGKIDKSQGLILGSPVYFSDVTPEMKAFIDVAGYVARGNDNLFRLKPGVAVAAVRRAGAIHTLDSMNHFFQIGEMIIPCSTYWNLAIGRNKGDVLNDEEGVQTMKNLGKNLAWLIKKLN